VIKHPSVHFSRDLVGQVLNWKPIALVGLLSYSLYLWQKPFLNRGSGAWVDTFPENLVLVFAAALAPYLLL
jgi:peptidoglycan/LPS O-acetylase OafA/YrhL